MNFNFGEVLGRAWQITWRYKSLWLAGVVVSLISLLSAPISLIFNPSFADPSEINRELPTVLLVNGLVMLINILSIPIYVIGMAIPSLGAFQVEKGSEDLKFGELVRGTLPYFWRILGIFLLVWLGSFIVAIVLMGCMVLISLLSFGLGAICIFPLMLLFIPLGILVYAVMEQSIAAIIVDGLGVSSALSRAWELVKKNLGVMALISIIIYLGSMVIGMIVALPMLIPMFGFMFDMIRTGTEPDINTIQNMTRSMVWWMLAFSPLYAVLQGILLAFMQAVWILTYMRLTKPQDHAPAILEANA